MMKKFNSVLFLMCRMLLVSSSILVAGCASNTALLPGAESIKVGTGPTPKGCQFRGNVSSSEEFIPLSEHKSVMEKQVNDLKNQAMKLDANIVIVTGHQTDYYSDIIISSAEVTKGIDVHAMLGRAYQCNVNKLNQLGGKK